MLNTQASNPLQEESRQFIANMDLKLNEIKDGCQKVKETFEAAFRSKQNLKINNAVTMVIYNQIYDAVEKGTDPSQLQVIIKVEDKFIQVYKDFITAFLVKMNNQFHGQPKDPESNLETFIDQYQNFKVFVKWLATVFNYLDRFHTKKNDQNLFTIAFKEMKEKYFEQQKGLFLKISFYFFNNARQYQTQVPKNMTKLIELFMIIASNKVLLGKNQMEQYDFGNEVLLGKNQMEQYDFKISDRSGANEYYQENFESPYIKELEKFYQNQCSQWMQLTTPEYVQKASISYHQEQSLSEEFFPWIKTSVKNILKIILIQDVGKALIDKQCSGVITMLNYHQHQFLRELYLLMREVPEMIPFITRRFIDYLEGIGSSINMVYQIKQDVAPPQGRQLNLAMVYIERILELMKISRYLVKKIFDYNMVLQKAYQTAFSIILNENKNSLAFLSIYADFFLKNDKIANDIKFKKIIKNIIKVFQFIYQRDLFFNYYQRQMSTRLLSYKYKNQDKERQLIQKFKGEAGTNAITKKLVTMINDVNSSEEFNNSIKSIISQFSKYEFSAQILTQGCWPQTSMNDSVSPPSSMQSVINEFEKRYLSKYSGRQINWFFNYGTGEVVFNATKERYFLVLNTLQIIAFLQFNQDEIMAVSEIIRRTNITKSELEVSLIPLVCAKIIKRQKADLEEFDDNEYLTLQMDFQNKQKKLLSLQNPKQAPSVEEQYQMEEIIKQREFIIDSQLVRIMKSRRQMKHTELVQDCQNMITLFRTDANFVKKRIESLIEREFIKRDEIDCNLYTYLN